jgi:hypothetical protein
MHRPQRAFVYRNSGLSHLGSWQYPFGQTQVRPGGGVQIAAHSTSSIGPSL